MSPTDCCDETRRLSIAPRFGSAMISNTDSTLLMYSTEYMLVKVYKEPGRRFQPGALFDPPYSTGIKHPRGIPRLQSRNGDRTRTESPILFVVGHMPRDIVSVEIGCSSTNLTPDGIQVQTKSGIVRIPWRDVKAAALAGRDRQEMPPPALIAEQVRQMQSQIESADTPFDWTRIIKSMELGATHDPQEMPSPAVMAEQTKQMLSRMKSAGISFDWTGMLKQMELSATHDPLWIVRRDEIICVLIESSGSERDALLMGMRTRLGARWLGEEFTGEQLEKRFCRWGFKRTFRVGRTLVLLFSAVILIVIVWTLVVYGLPIATQELFGAFFAELLAGEWQAALILGILLAGFLLLSLGVKKVISRSRYRRFWTLR
jgi:hypothetical protein